MTRYMWDAVTLANVPADAKLVACYANGTYQNIAEARRRFPNALLVPISVRASYTGPECRVLDVEPGDATPAQAVGWVRAMRAQGVDPTVYCNTSQWPSVRAAFASAGVAEPHYWVAHYDGVDQVPSGAVAKQFLGDYHGYDKSVVADYWPGVDPKPTPPPPPPQSAAPAGVILVNVQGYSTPYLLTEAGVLKVVSAAQAAAYRAVGVDERTLTGHQVAAIQGGFG